MPEIRPISIADYLDTAAGLMQAHQSEIEAHLSEDGPHLLTDIFLVLDRNGCVVAFGAFDNDSLVGYSVLILTPHLHYGYLYAHHDAVYLCPEYRRGRLGLDLIKAAEQEATRRGAVRIVWYAKPHSTFFSLLDRLGYEVEEIVYRKDLNHV